MINTGNQPLRAGDKVRMVIDVLDVVKGRRDAKEHITGIPRTKVVARLAHVLPSNQLFADIARGITSRDINVRVDEPSVLIPNIEYMGRERHIWQIGEAAPAFVLDNDNTIVYVFADPAYTGRAAAAAPPPGFDIYDDN